MSGASHTHNNDALETLKREAQWAATTWHLVCIANYSRTSDYARKEASRFGWGKKARHSVEALAKVYFQHGQSAFLETIQEHAPTLYEDDCLCESHHGIDENYCDCCDTYSTSCLCHCHFCVHCDIEANKCSGPDDCDCDCHGNDCCGECQGCCWCQCHNCLDCNSPTEECGDYCECESHTACDACSFRHAANEEDEEEDDYDEDDEQGDDDYDDEDDYDEDDGEDEDEDDSNDEDNEQSGSNESEGDEEDLEEIRRSLQAELESLALSQRRTIQKSEKSRESWMFRVAEAIARIISAPFRWIVDSIRGFLDGLFGS